MSIIILRIIYFTVVLCVHVSVLYLFYIKRCGSQTCFHSTFKQRIAICMCMHTRGHQTMVTETSKKINFWGCFVYNIVIYWIAILFIGVTFFYWQVFLRCVKATNETTTLLRWRSSGSRSNRSRLRSKPYLNHKSNLYCISTQWSYVR